MKMENGSEVTDIKFVAGLFYAVLPSGGRTIISEHEAGKLLMQDFWGTWDVLRYPETA